jgi:hypothetical protein
MSGCERDWGNWLPAERKRQRGDQPPIAPDGQGKREDSA